MADSKLTHEAKAEIRQYLFKLLLPTGGIVGLILLGLGWTVSEMGFGFAYNKALEEVQSDIVVMARDVGKSAAETEKAKQAAEAAQKDTEAAKARAVRIVKDLEVAKVSSTIGDAVERLSKDTNFVSLIAGATNADWKSVSTKLNRARSEWGVKQNERGYGFEAWKHEDKSVHCPDGSYVTGIRVRYSGTCQRECDKDGGIVREILLTCHSVFE